MSKKYAYGRIERLAESLGKFDIAPEIRAEILQGGEEILSGTPPVKKADWMREAMLRMNRLLDLPTRQAVREGCACCLGGKRLKLAQEIAAAHATLEERIAAANQARFVFGHSVTQPDAGHVLVAFAPDGQEGYRCVCLPQAREPLPVTYCYCCGGHVRHHLETALGQKLGQLTVLSSPLSTGGKKPCKFLFSLS
jgi:hypothetical protein